MTRFLLAATVLAGCGSPPPAEPSWVWPLSSAFPTPKVPDENPMSEEKVVLGRRLFYDRALSRNREQSCASCHDQALAFTDGRVHARGSTGQAHRRNAQGLTNVAWASTLTWANPLVGTLERQALLPLFGESPVELGWAGQEAELVARLESDVDARPLWVAAFGDEAVSIERLTHALASFERTLISCNAPFDRAVAGEAPLSDDALAGQALFNSERLECYHCHTGFTFSDSVMHAGTGVAVDRPFHNTGLYDLDQQGSYPSDDTGLFEITARAGDMGRFRAPSLRNLRFTAPYMHDGSLATLDDVLDAYAAGGHARLRSGRPSPLQSDLVRGFELTAVERRQLLAFLDSLNDPLFVTTTALGDPQANPGIEQEALPRCAGAR